MAEQRYGRIIVTGCSVEGCARPLVARGMCRGHYNRAWSGREVAGPIRSFSSLAERFWFHVDKQSDCWVWTGPRAKGYGVFNIGYGRIAAHRWAYENEHGAIAAGLELDHLCRNTGCVRPTHLEPVTHRENVRRSNNFAGIQSRRTHCPRGHEYSDANTRVSRNGERSCRTCHRDRERARYQEKAAA